MPSNQMTNPPKEFQARSYQLRLVDYLTERNGIVYLPTGAGKTFVAILALKRFSMDFDKTIENGGKRAIFMCNTVELARQQAVAIRTLTNFEVGFFVGEQGVDNWNRSKWEVEINKNQVLVGTAQVMLDLLLHSHLSLGSVSIVVIDECHHGTGRHPYREFMRLFLHAGPDVPLPRVVGLTGVLIKGNEIVNVLRMLRDLETTFHGNIITVSNTMEMENVMLYSTKPKEFFLLYPNQIHSFEIIETIKSYINAFQKHTDTLDIGRQPVRFSKGLQSMRDPNKKSALKGLLNDFVYQLDTYGIYTGSIAIVALLVEFEIKKRQSETLVLRSIYRMAIALCDNIRHLLVRKLRDMLDDDESSDGKLDTEEIIYNFSTPRVQKFLQYLKQTFSNKNPKDICCLVFVERRYTCKSIYGMLLHYIASVPELKNVLVPQFLVGRNGINQNFDTVLERKWYNSAIQQFREGEANLMVCSSVLEEGIDVQACNYVIILDPLKTFNSYVQTKGRARSKNAFFLILSSEMDKPKTAKQITDYQKAHAAIATYLQERVLERAEPQMDEITEHFRDIIPPYKNEYGSLLFASSALALLHRYCQSMPTDAFGFVMPWYKLLDIKERLQLIGKSAEYKHVVSINLPINSKLRDTVYSKPMECSSSAKISAAFNACIELYKKGELNKKFLPTTLTDRLADVADVHFKHWKKYGEDVSKIKEKKETKLDNTSTYPTRCPSQFYDTRPRVGEICYAYEIFLKPHFERNGYTEHMYESLQTKRGYALLLRKPLPRLAEMPLFSSHGKIHVSVAEQPHEVLLKTEQQLEQLHQFHTMLFRDVLKIWHSYFVMDKRSKENSYLVVPLNADSGDVIDWPLVAKFYRGLSQPRLLSLDQRRKQAPPRPDDFEGRIVTQWYANYQDKRMLVTKVHRDKTPMTMMEDSQKDNTYYEYTMSKYKNVIDDVVHQQQFLIEVRELSQQMNFFVGKRIKSSGQSKARAKIILIPELCFNFDFPGDLWVKLLFLPSILHRLHYLLHADALRQRMNTYLGLHLLPQNGSDYKPKVLEIDLSLRRNVDTAGNAISNESEEQRSMLEPLPTREIENSMERLQISDLETPWQSYMEPVDLHRNIMAVHPVELLYYCQFTSGMIVKLDKMEEEDKEYWTQTQFNMPKENIYGSDSNANKSLPALLPSTNTAPVEQLSVLQKTFSNDHITPAEQCEFLAALTTSGSSDVFDMERLELLGDSFLKMSATLYLTSMYPDWNEGNLTQLKSKLVSNRNLLYCMNETDIPSKINSSLFAPKYNWKPPSTSLPYNILNLWQEQPDLAKLVAPKNLYGLKLSKEEIESLGALTPENYQKFVEGCQINLNSPQAHADANYASEINFCVDIATLSNKVVADTLEALLGVIVKNYGLQHGFRLLEYFGICKQVDIGKPLSQLLDLQLGSERTRAARDHREIDGLLINYRYLERNLGYTFKDRAYLLQALTHPSNPTNRLTGCYQELEFIGDAILDFLISAYIFQRNIRMNPGQLTDLRSALVNNTTLACICVRHCFHLFILAENALLSESINKFVEFQIKQGHRVTHHVRILLEESDMQLPSPMDEEDEMEMANNSSQSVTNDLPPERNLNMSENVDVPKALGDVVEALIAAVYLDCRDLQRTWEVVYKLFEPELIEFSRNVPINPMRQLYEHKLAKPIFSPAIIDQGKVMVTCTFTCNEKTIKVYGFGTNSSQAKLAASKHALRKLVKSEA